MAKWDPAYLDQAQEAYERAVELAPSSPLFLSQWAMALEKAGKGEEAAVAFGKAFQVDADFTAKFLGQMAVTDYDQGDRTQAFRRLAVAIEGHPQGPEAYYVRGRLYLLEGRKRQASLDLLKVKTLAPTPEGNPAIQDLDRYLEETGN
jgi:tetratricopeptide (TPR) repeat protein